MTKVSWWYWAWNRLKNQFRFSGWQWDCRSEGTCLKVKSCRGNHFVLHLPFRSKLKMEDIKEVNKALKVLTPHGWFDWTYTFHLVPSHFTLVTPLPEVAVEKHHHHWQTALELYFRNELVSTVTFCSHFLGSYLAEGWWSHTLQAMWQGVLNLQKEGSVVQWLVSSFCHGKQKLCWGRCFRSRSGWHDNYREK